MNKKQCPHCANSNPEKIFGIGCEGSPSRGYINTYACLKCGVLFTTGLIKEDTAFTEADAHHAMTGE